MKLERAHLNRPVGWLGLLGLVLIPVIIAASFTAATWKSDTRLSKVEAAIVNLDEAVEMDGQLVPMGRQLAAGLVEGDPDRPDLNINWVLSDPDDAAAGLESGRYAAVVTIPPEFSAAATSFGGEAADAEQAVLQIETSKVSGLTDPQVAQAIIDTASNTMGSFLTETFIDGIFGGFNEMGEQFGEVADGTQELADGAQQLADGTSQTADGVDELADGMQLLASGGLDLAAGGRQLADGTGELAAGLGQMRDQTAGLPGQAQQLADGAGQLADGADGLATGVNDFSGGVQQYTDGVGEFASGTEQYIAGVQQYATGVKQLADGAQPMLAPLIELAESMEGIELPSAEDLEATMAQLEQLPGALRGAGSGITEVTGQIAVIAENGLPAPTIECPADLVEIPGACEAFQEGFAAGWQDGTQTVGQALHTGVTTPDPNTGLSFADSGPLLVTAADEVEAGVGALAGLVEMLGSLDLGDGSTSPADGLRQFSAGLTELSTASDQIIAGGTGLTEGAQQVAGGGSGLAQGADQLAGGLDQFAGGVREFATGTQQLPAGLAQLADGISQTADGAAELSAGVAQFSAGVDEYAGGVGMTAAGTTELAAGVTQLDEGMSELADGTDQLATGLAEGLADLPSYTDAERANLASVVASPVTTDLGDEIELMPLVSTTALLMTMALWLGALATYVLVQAVSARTLTSSRPSWQLALRSIWPGLAVAAVQAVALAAVGQMVLELSAARLFGVLGILLLAGATFVVINHALVAWFGGVGRIISVAMVVLSVSGSITSAVPDFFLTVRPWLPLTPALDALRATMIGGSGIAGNLSMLMIWLVVGASAGVLAVVRSRTVSAAALVRQFA